MRLSLSRQSKPSILEAGLLPKLARMHPPFLADEEVDDIDGPEGIGIACGEIGEKLSSPNRVS